MCEQHINWTLSGCIFFRHLLNLLILGQWHDRWIIPCHAESISGNKNIIAFSISLYCDGPADWNHSSWKTMACVCNKVNIMVADDLVMQWARTLTAMVLACFSWNTPDSAPKVCWVGWLSGNAFHYQYKLHFNAKTSKIIQYSQVWKDI